MLLSPSILLKLKGEGSHRQLSSTIKFDIEKSTSQCSIHENPHNRSCIFKLEPEDSETDLTWSIPVGKRSDARTVNVVTFVSALLSVPCSLLSTQVRQHNVSKQCN
ncbi:hypothetical protein SDJN03_03880, partial [Cucurbita argyrosperma subsp. sororia]